MKCPNSCTTIININASIAITTYKMLSITLWNEQSDENINYYLIVWRMYFLTVSSIDKTSSTLETLLPLMKDKPF